MPQVVGPTALTHILLAGYLVSLLLLLNIFNTLITVIIYTISPFYLHCNITHFAHTYIHILAHSFL